MKLALRVVTEGHEDITIRSNDKDVFQFKCRKMHITYGRQVILGWHQSDGGLYGFITMMRRYVERNPCDLVIGKSDYALLKPVIHSPAFNLQPIIDAVSGNKNDLEVHVSDDLRNKEGRYKYSLQRSGYITLCGDLSINDVVSCLRNDYAEHGSDVKVLVIDEDTFDALQVACQEQALPVDVHFE